jgi:hypothetical protein
LFVCIQVLQRDREIINDDRVKIEAIGSANPHPMSEYGQDSFGFQMISRSIRQVFASDDVLVSPGDVLVSSSFFR